MINQTALTAPSQGYIFSNGDWNGMYPRKNYENKESHSLDHIVHYLLGLNQPDKAIIGFINKMPQHADTPEQKRTLQRLVRQDSKNYDFTPLMIATMRGRVGVVKALLDFNRRCGQLEETINSKDSHGWTVLHHASLCSSTIFVLLQEYGASLQAKTPFDGTPSDLKKLAARDVKPLHLDRIFFEDPDSGELHALSLLGQEILSQKTGLAVYRETPFVECSAYKALWEGKMPEVEKNLQYLHTHFFGKPARIDYPSLVIGKSPQLEGASCWEVRANQLIPFCSVIGEYTGEMSSDEMPYNTLEEWHTYIKSPRDDYFYKPVDATSVGNMTRWFNWGWPNCSALSMNATGFNRNYFVASELNGIQQGEPILWDYGLSHPGGFFSPFTIFGREKMREYFKQGLQCLLEGSLAPSREKFQSMMRRGIARQEDYLKELSFSAKIVFPLNAPAALLDLHFNGIVKAKEWILYLEKFRKNELPEMIFLWKSLYGWQSGLVLSTLLRIEECENTLQGCSLEKRNAAVQWILSSIGHLSVVDILKGMDVIGAEIHLKEWEEVEKDIGEVLEGYDWTQDVQAPIGIQRHAEDMACAYKKMFQSKVLETAIILRDRMPQGSVMHTIQDRVVQILKK